MTSYIWNEWPAFFRGMDSVATDLYQREALANRMAAADVRPCDSPSSGAPGQSHGVRSGPVLLPPHIRAPFPSGAE